MCICLFTSYAGDVTSQMSQTFLPSVLHRLRSEPTTTPTSPMPTATYSATTTNPATTPIAEASSGVSYDNVDSTEIGKLATKEQTPPSPPTSYNNTVPSPSFTAAASDSPTSSSSSSSHDIPAVVELPPSTRTLYYSALLTTINRLVNASLLIGAVNSTVAYFLLTQGARVSTHCNLLMNVYYVHIGV